MKYLKQLIAYRANREDSRTGHFFEGRFHLGAILGEDGLIAAMAYVDLNPVRAKIVASFEQYEETSARLRLTRNTARSLKQAIKPLYSGIKLARPALSFSMQDYFNILSTAYNDYQNPDVGDRESRWSAAIASFGKKQRAYGSAEALKAFAQERNWAVVGIPLSFS